MQFPLQCLTINNNNFYKFSMFQSATPNDLWTAMQTALDKSPFKEYTFNVSQKMATWIKKTYYPVVNVIQDNPKHVIVWLKETGIKNESWWIPVTITTQTKPNFFQNFFSHGQWIKSQNLMYCEFSLPYEENGWIIANLQQAGKYKLISTLILLSQVESARFDIQRYHLLECLLCICVIFYKSIKCVIFNLINYLIYLI